MTREKLRVCGECDPATRYFRRAICSLDSKVRKAVDSCVQGRSRVEISGKNVFGAVVHACVRQRLSNEPVVLYSFVRVARDHKNKADEQRAWRRNCERRWTEYRHKRMGATAIVAAKPDGVGGLLLRTRPAYTEVWIDGKRHAKVTPPRGYLTIQDVQPGEHRIDLRYHDSHRLSTTVNVIADANKKYELRLKRRPTCSSDRDCVGHDSGPHCHTVTRRCSCHSNSECSARPQKICKPWWHNAPSLTCQAGWPGQYCLHDAHCRSGSCLVRPGHRRGGSCK